LLEKFTFVPTVSFEYSSMMLYHGETFHWQLCQDPPKCVLVQHEQDSKTVYALHHLESTWL